MKKTWKKLWVASAGAALVFAGCQTAQIHDNYQRSPAMGKKQTPPPDNSGNGDQSSDNGQSGDMSTATELVRITTINGTYNQDHGPSVDVHPGDIVQISADVFNASGDGFAAENRDVSEFIWNGDDSTSDVCAASASGDCLDNSNFQVNDYGVSFYVPQNMGQQITITVSDASSPNAGSDSIILNNVMAGYVPPTVIATSPSQYACSDFNADCALAHQGNWVYIDGMRYFVPFTSDPSWEPYQHGYWTWVDGDGWTWVSYDSWGWYTDHYGYWRHHGVYGWIWSPFDDNVYRPAPVSWYYNDGYVGWYPYYDAWNNSHPYWGAEHGFDDGYWGGYHEGAFYSPYHPGFYYVAYGDFGASDVYAHRPNGFDGPGTYGSCYESQHFGAWPGGTDINSSHDFMNARSPNVMITHADAQQFGKSNMRFPTPVRQVPSQYATVPGQAQRLSGKPIPVGSTFKGDQVVAPTDNHRGITAPPVVRGGDGSVAALPPRTQTPAHAASGSNYHPPVTPAKPPQVPVYHPGQNGGSVPNVPGHNGGNNGNNGNGNHPVTPPNNGGGNGNGNHPVTPPNNGGGNGNGNHPVTPPNNGGGNGNGNHPVTPPNNGGNNGGNSGNHPVTPPTQQPKPKPPKQEAPEQQQPANNGDDDQQRPVEQPARPVEQQQPTKPKPRGPASYDDGSTTTPSSDQ